MDVKLIQDAAHLQFWGADITLDLFFGGLGVGAFIFAVLVSFFYGDRLSKVSRIASFLTPITVALGLFFLILHLGRPWRFYLVLLNFNVTSPLSWGAWLQGIFFGLSVIYAFLWFVERGESPGNPKLRRGIGYIGMPFALAVGVYHGLLLMTFKSRPLWNTGPTVLMAICGFIITGIALVMLILSISPRNKELLRELRTSRNILGGFILIQLFTIALWITSLYFGPGDSHEAMLRLITQYGLLFWGGAIVIGLVLPVVIGTLALFSEREKETISRLVPFLTSLMVLIGGFLLRYVTIIAVQ